MADKVLAYSKATGAEIHVPPHFLELSKEGVQGFTDITDRKPATPSAKETGQAAKPATTTKKED